MKYQIIGAMRQTIETKKGSHFRRISVIPVLKDDRWIGLNGEQLTLWDSALSNTSIETVNGEWYAKDDKRYYIDIDYDANGWIQSCRIYNG